MRHVHLISASLFALAIVTAGAAVAADLPARPLVKAPVAAPPPFSWTGFYIGANIGGAWAGGDIINNATGASVGIGSSGAFIGGGQLGYNYQFYNNWVVGIEGTVDGVGSNDKSTNNVVIGPNTFNVVGRATWDATLAGRLGYAADNWLFYAKGGGAWVGVDATVNNLTTGTSISRSASQGGWMAGGGVEWAFAPSWSAKLEYDYLGINGEQIGTNAGTVFTLHNPNIQQVTVGVNYLFH